MGLEIFYDLHAPETWSDDDARDALESALFVAAAQGFAEVDSAVRRLDPEKSLHATLICRAPPGTKERDDTPLRIVRADDGWQFRTWPGQGCETAFFGLALFPRRYLDGERWRANG